MTLALTSNLLLALLCLGVIVQTRRLMGRLRTVTDGSMQATVAALDKATAEARAVLEGLRRLLADDGAAVARNVAAARALQDELGVLIGLADAMAERLVEARRAPVEPPEKAPPADTAAAEPPRKPAARRRKAKNPPEKAEQTTGEDPADNIGTGPGARPNEREAA